MYRRDDFILVSKEGNTTAISAIAIAFYLLLLSVRKIASKKEIEARKKGMEGRRSSVVVL